MRWTALVCCVTTSMLAACSAPLTQVRIASDGAYAPHREAQNTGVFRGRLLFISDSSWPNSLYIYTLPGLKRIKTISGIAPPSGVCADNGGNVWVAYNSTSQLGEYSHEGTLKTTLTLPSGQFPESCAVAPNNDLAITTDPDGVGYAKVAIYSGGSGTPFSLHDPNSNQENYAFAGYDAKDDLYFDVTPRNTFRFVALYECAAPCSAGSTLKKVVLNETISTAGMVEWDYQRHDLVVGDQTCQGNPQSCVYRVNTKTHKIDGVTYLMGPGNKPICDLIEGTINRSSDFILGADNQSGIGCPHYSNEAYRWNYPSGASVKSDSEYLEGPIGAAISIPHG